VWVAEKVSFN